ncbi:Ycf66 family protein [Mastigocladopsis repens]|uniref:Ycf66 family protein n=1 Tax=Mastigocladopsis repens TaxID=221287 RepID=UPI0003684430|nr:Ycf66 family protein [Mastigocladopsis repens]
MLMFGLNSASVLAQVNFGANSASILGIFLAVAGAALYFLRSVRPELSRDQDIFFAAVGLLCGFILVFQGWRLDPILQFGQLLLAGSTIFFAVESIRLRGIATQQAKRNTPIVDDEREVSDNYRYNRKYKAQVDAELEPLPYEDDYDERPVRGRISGSRDSRSSRDDYYEDETPRRPERRNGSERLTTTDKTDKTRRRSSGRSVRPSERFDDEDWSASKTVDNWDSSTTEEKRPPRRGSNGPVRPETRDEDVPPRPRKRRTPTESSPRREREDDEVISTEYVDYKPIDRSERSGDDLDNSSNFDDDV